MIPKHILKDLMIIRIKDSEALFEKRRYLATIYLSGYAREMALKYKICRMYFLNRGFPETKSEFQSYYLSGSKQLLSKTIMSLQEIRSHDLRKLLFYSGVEVKVQLTFFDEWNLVSAWNPELRYKNSAVRKQVAREWLDAVKAVLKGIF